MIDNLFNIKNKVVVVSGASGFIGGEISCLLAEAGCAVALLYNNNKPNDRLIKRLINSKSSYKTIKCDVTIDSTGQERAQWWLCF